MTYTKPWNLLEAASSDSWHRWLLEKGYTNDHYKIQYQDGSVIVEFFNGDAAQAFALHFGL